MIRTNETHPKEFWHAIARRAGAALPRNSMRRVIVVFVVLFAVLLQLMTATLGWPAWTTFMSATAAAGGWCARLLGVHATVSGNLISLSSRSLSVDPQCTGYSLAALYIALVLAYPVRWRMRLLAIAVGLPVLVLTNIARLGAVAVASERLADRPFLFVHDYLMEFGMIFVLLMVWATWLGYARQRA